jgi:hypothetical protein
MAQAGDSAGCNLDVDALVRVCGRVVGALRLSEPDRIDAKWVNWRCRRDVGGRWT